MFFTGFLTILVKKYFLRRKLPTMLKVIPDNTHD